jgi:hypothetical protein
MRPSTLWNNATRKGFIRRQEPAKSKVRGSRFVCVTLGSITSLGASEFTGISAPYEPPLNPELHIKTAECEVKEAVQIIADYLLEKGYITGS